MLSCLINWRVGLGLLFALGAGLLEADYGLLGGAALGGTEALLRRLLKVSCARCGAVLEPGRQG